MPRISIVMLFLLLLVGLGCGDSKKDQEIRILTIPRFDENKAYENIEKQLSFGPRSHVSNGKDDCRDWLVSQFNSYAFTTTIQSFESELYTGETVTGSNIIARWNPDIKERLLLCAHWDTRPEADKDSSRMEEPIAGADDGASGVGVLLEIARQASLADLPMGLDIVLFDLEDSGEDGESGDYLTWGLGSQYWSKNLPEENYEVKYGILLDMVGAQNATFPKEQFSRQSAPQVVQKIWDLGIAMGRDRYFKDQPVDGVVDDHLFIIQNARIPMVDIINLSAEGRFGSYHHTHRDDIEIISKETLSAVGQVVLAVVFKESNKEF